MSRLNRKFIQIILAVLITNIIQGQEIKTKEQAVIGKRDENLVEK